MRDYAKVSPQFWIGETGRQLRQQGQIESLATQLVALHLVTSPHANMVGVYYIPIVLIAHEIGISTEQAHKCLQTLCQLGYCSYDVEKEYVWVHEMASYQIDTDLKPNDNRVKNINSIIQALPALSYLPEFYQRYQTSLCLSPHPALETLRERRAVNQQVTNQQAAASISDSTLNTHLNLAAKASLNSSIGSNDHFNSSTNLNPNPVPQSTDQYLITGQILITSQYSAQPSTIQSPFEAPSKPLRSQEQEEERHACNPLLRGAISLDSDDNFNSSTNSNPNPVTQSTDQYLITGQALTTSQYSAQPCTIHTPFEALSKALRSQGQEGGRHAYDPLLSGGVSLDSNDNFNLSANLNSNSVAQSTEQNSITGQTDTTSQNTAQPCTIQSPFEAPSKPLRSQEQEQEKEQEKEQEQEKRARDPLLRVQLTIPLSDGCGYLITQQQIDDWQKAYPLVDIVQTLRDIREWNIANPNRRKTKAGIHKHITHWLMRQQNNAQHYRYQHYPPYQALVDYNQTVGEKWLARSTSLVIHSKE